MAMGAGLRPKAKGLDKPPDPTVRAPALDPTGRGRLDSLVTKGLAAYLMPRMSLRASCDRPKRKRKERRLAASDSSSG